DPAGPRRNCDSYVLATLSAPHEREPRKNANVAISGGRDRGAAGGHGLDRRDERGRVALGDRLGVDEGDVGEAAEELLEHDLDLHAGEAGAEAEVRTEAE